MKVLHLTPFRAIGAPSRKVWCIEVPAGATPTQIEALRSQWVEAVASKDPATIVAPFGIKITEIRIPKGVKVLVEDSP